MAFGQKNYNEIMGISGKYRISQIGCFLTSFCNLLDRYGKAKTPLELNAIFRDRGIYTDVDDGIRDDLGWAFITRYDPEVVMTASGQGVPPHNDCIVKFNFKSGNGLFSTHFCLVADASKGIIVDSFDGVLKNWSVYGGPIAWASYRNNKPTPPVAVQPVPTSPAYNGQEITVLPGWGISHAAKAAGFSDFGSQDRWNAIARLNGHDSYTNLRLFAGMRIKVGSPTPVAPAPQPANDTVVVQPGWGISHVAKAAGYADFGDQARWNYLARLNGHADSSTFRLSPNMVVKVRGADPAVTPAPVPAPTPPAPVVAPAPTPAEVEQTEKIAVRIEPKNYKDSFKPDPKMYIAKVSEVIPDLDGMAEDVQLVAGQRVPSAGEFEKDGETYLITEKHRTEGTWYGINKKFVVPFTPGNYVEPLRTDDAAVDAELDDMLNNADLISEAKEALQNTTSYENTVSAAGRFWGKIGSFFSKLFKKDKKEGITNNGLSTGHN